ncbi:MAG TPA: SGNH/GDSL hydrolase family protein [Abditibacteriaceae bacterium]
MRTLCSNRANLYSALLALCISGCGDKQIPTPTAETTHPVLQPVVPPTEFFFRDGDRPIVLIGDSITQQRQYSTLIESFVLSRFPTWNVTVRNSGWNGDTASLVLRGGFENGLKRDILSLNPKSATIAYGMNDARGGDTSVDHSRKLVRALKEAGTRVALITPSPEENYEAGQPAGSAYNNLLLKYSAGLQLVAREEGVLFVDQIRPMIGVIEAGRKAGVLGATGGARLIPDAVHPNWGGHLVMASSILKGLGAPSLVSRVEIDADKFPTRLVGAQNARVKLATGARPARVKSIRFQRMDNALPWPIHPDTELPLKIPGYKPIDELSRYELKVTGLTQPKYEVSIDNVAVGIFTREALGAGVNLSQNAGPISAQSQNLLKKILDKNNLYFTRWRDVQLHTDPAWSDSAVTGTQRNVELMRLDARIAEAEKEIEELRKPVMHVWEIAPASTP